MTSDINAETDHAIRDAALAHCEALRAAWGDAIPARLLTPFNFCGEKIHLYAQQGVFKPKQISDTALSLRTTLGSSYEDEVRLDGETILYDFAPRDHQNDYVKRASEQMLPLIYLVQVKTKPEPEYMVVAPVFVTGWDNRARKFQVVYEPAAEKASEVQESDPLSKRYGLRVMRSRLHQAHFRRQVLTAYRNRCSVCELRVRPLLDGAHIVPDAGDGEPSVQNGLSLCANHHRAFDRKILRVRADSTIEVDRDQVEANDGAAKIALLDHHGRKLTLPTRRELWPSPERLASS
jgi:putative restriction endonuclease